MPSRSCSTSARGGYSSWRPRGCIPRAEKGRYDLLRCIRAYVMYLQRRADGLGVESSGMSDERVRLVAAQAEHEELEVAELQPVLAAPRRCPGRLGTTQGRVQRPMPRDTPEAIGAVGGDS